MRRGEHRAIPRRGSDNGTSVAHRPRLSRLSSFLNDVHEHIFHLTHQGDVTLDRLAIGVPHQDVSNVTRWAAGATARCRGNTWFIPYETIQRRDQDRPHPATFPVRLPEWCLRLHGLSRTQVVLDPFLGIGSTTIAATTLGIPTAIGIEIDPVYLAEATARTRAASAAFAPTAPTLDAPRLPFDE